MNAEFNELLPVFPDEYPQIWIISTREQVTHQINEFYVKRIATDFCISFIHEFGIAVYQQPMRLLVLKSDGYIINLGLIAPISGHK